MLENTNRFNYLRPLLKEMKALNVYQVNIFQPLKFMYETKYGINPRIFIHQYR